jgi:electron transfer flavoprotein alpha subunit
MSHYIVLVKQVPDVSQVTDQAFDPQTGNLVRSRLPNVINELDTQALAFAHHMRRLGHDPEAKVVVLTMGPPMAEEILRYSLARCADAAVLLTDKALGGADTVATANPLAFAIRKIARDLLGGTDDYVIVSGMQSVDGDTAQVPPQLAEEMGLSCIAYVTDVRRTDGRFEFARIISGGTQVVACRRLPVVVTVAKYPYPLFAGFATSRWANAVKVIQWGAEDIKATLIGVKGSKTTVIRVFPPAPTTRRCVHVETAEQLAQVLADSLRKGGVQSDQVKTESYLLPVRRTSKRDRRFEATEREQQDYQFLADQLKEFGVTDPGQVDQATLEKIVAASHTRLNAAAVQEMLQGYKATEPEYKGPVWVVAEYDGRAVHTSTFELVGKARQLADGLGAKVGVCVAGSGLDKVSDSLIAAGADEVILVDHPLLVAFDPITYRKAVADAIAAHWPQIVLYAATPQGRALAPMISYRLSCGLTADCTGLDIRDVSRKGEIGLLLQTRPALGGNVMATIRTKNSCCQMATIRPGVMTRLPADPKRKGRVIRHPVELTDQDLSWQVLQTERASADVDFGVDLIVSGGRGLQTQAAYQQTVSDLCKVIADGLHVRVQKGASRSAVERGFTERAYQVGQTGTSVAPTVYLALGISGAIQHMIGVAKSQTIVAINSDPHAPIFKYADYYLVGTAEQAVPSLTSALQGLAKGGRS